MNEDLAEMHRLLAEVDQSLRRGKRRQAINRLRRPASAASTMALTLEMQCR
jgi:hypothetical protein